MNEHQDFNQTLRDRAQRGSFTVGTGTAPTGDDAPTERGRRIQAAMAELTRAEQSGDATRASHASKVVDHILDEARLDSERERLDNPPAPEPVISFDAGARRSLPEPPNMNRTIRRSLGYE